MRYLITLLLTLGFTTPLWASCDTDYNCYLLGSHDLLGVQAVNETITYYGKEINDSLEVQCDNGEIFIIKVNEFSKSVETMCTEVHILNYPCDSDAPDYSGWCGSDKQIKQYEDNKKEYKNEDSGIEAYWEGTKWISVKFKNSNTRYTYNSTHYGQKTIDYLKELANKGHGLNSYINEMVNYEKNAVRLINNLCGDTWCEGHTNYKFTKVICLHPLEECEVFYTIINDDNKAMEGTTGSKILKDTIRTDFYPTEDNELQEEVQNKLFDLFD